jgi:hypothetical protein
MSLGLAFWILMLIWLVFGLWSSWPFEGIKPLGGTLVLFLLLLLLGWKVFGPPLHG